jgi:hypothetical protein
MRTRALASLFGVGLIALLSGCGGDESKDIALEVARDWVQRNTRGVEAAGSVVSQIGEAVVKELPPAAKVAALLVAGLVEQEIGWTYAEPIKGTDDLYEVTAMGKATITIKIPLTPDRAYDIEVDLLLDVDVPKRQVVSTQLDPSSLRVRRR